ncbi:zinc ribbon domain-containing protein [Halobacteria archaeon AArc-m2/3/4]|uniref:Zinc ribbon domain-containing protein n=1 Tax=Natronoglomus mannanivorans TaxID=2979990 RepID=A0ABT2Q8A7_9EURY|nr:zinc ribbon domain-containing protein [Halobacteria archaeon AArc-m2/3/4]
MTKAIENDWEVEHDFGDHVVLIRRSLGSTGTHILIAFFTVWWTMGMGNALYAAYCYYSNAERRVLWADHAKQSETSRSAVGTGAGAGAGAGVRDSTRETVDSSSSGSLGTTILLWFGALIMVAAAQASATVLWTVLFAVVAILFALSGASSLSPVRRRLEKRRSITDNGWTRSVRERAVVNSDETCTACAGRVGHGVERTYCKDFSVLGVPVTTSEHGTNYYCRRCANGEVQSSEPTPESESESESDQSHERAHLERSDEDGDERQTQKRERKQGQEQPQHTDQNQTKEDVDTSVDHEQTAVSDDSDSDHDYNREREHEREHSTEPS